jgi:hypothetical protein
MPNYIFSDEQRQIKGRLSNSNYGKIIAGENVAVERTLNSSSRTLSRGNHETCTRELASFNSSMSSVSSL